MEIGQKLKDKRTALGLTQEDLAAKIGVTRQTIANWEKGKTYPDVGSVLKLSDLYSVSLDELLKEDAAMRKHTEEAADLPRRYWNILFEVAILLLPFGLLLAYWGLPTFGVVLQYIGLLMLPPLWYFRYKLLGMEREDLRYSVIGWILYIVSAFFRMGNPENTFSLLIALVMQLTGLMMVYRHGVYLEKSTRFWLVIALYVGIPAFVMGSGLLGLLADHGAFSKAQPFGHDYRIEQIEIGTAEDQNAIIHLHSFPPNLEIDEETIGIFEYAEPTSQQMETSRGIWHLIPEESSDALYKLEVNTEDKTTLSYFVDDQLQWRWVLKKIPAVWFGYTTAEQTSAAQMDWFTAGTYSGDPSMINRIAFTGEARAFLQCNFEGITELTLVEEYYHNDKSETQTYTLIKDKSGNFPISDAFRKRYDGDGQYAVYRLQWDGGEYLLCLQFE